MVFSAKEEIVSNPLKSHPVQDPTTKVFFIFYIRNKKAVDLPTSTVDRQQVFNVDSIVRALPAS